MDRNLTLGVLLKLTDGMSKPAERAMLNMTRSAQQAASGIAKTSSATTRMYQDRERLGVRSEQRIQREIRVTEAAYQRLLKSGSLSWREQTRAADSMRRKVTELNNEMGKLTTTQRMLQGGRFAAGMVAGGVAAGYVLKPGVEKAMAYDLRLAHMANTAFADRNVAGRRAGTADLNSTIVKAIRYGGGNRDQAAETLDALIASGALSVGDAKGMLPTLMRAATASGSNASELSQIAIRGMQTFKIKAADMPRIIDMSIAAGQAGGFELKDMAKFLPQQMAAATMSGLSGTGGFAKLVALNQATAITAGTKDEAGNNLVNLLAKINSADTAIDAKKMGLNLPKYLADQRAKGVDSVDAFVGLVDQSVSKNKAWKQLQAKLAGAKDDAAKRETLESMSSIVQGSGVGKLVQDRQALMALIGIMNNRQYLGEVQKKTLGGAGAAEKNFAVISGTASFKTSQAGNEKEIAQQRAMDGLTPSIGALSDKVVEAARAYPNMTTATVAATGALAALAAAVGAAGLTSILTGGGGAKVAAAGAGAMLSRAGGFALKRALPLYGAFGVGQWAGGGINSGMNWGLSKLTGHDTSLGSLIYDLTHKEQKVGLDVNLKIDQDGRATVGSIKPSRPGVRLNVDTGPYMAGG